MGVRGLKASKAPLQGMILDYYLICLLICSLQDVSGKIVLLPCIMAYSPVFHPAAGIF